MIGFSQFGKVDLSLDTCNCINAGLPGETLILENQGEYLLLWNGNSYTDAVLYGNPGLSNTPPFGTLVTLGVIPTVGLGGCASQLPLSFPPFSTINTLPLQDHSYARMPDQSGNWKREDCGTKGRCNALKDNGLPIAFGYDIPDSLCDRTLYFKVLVDELPGSCPPGPTHSLAGPFEVYVSCPRSEFTAVLCPQDSLIINGTVHNKSKPQGMEIFQSSSNCDSVVQVSLTFLPEATVAFLADTVLCIGDSIDLAPTFTGVGPFFLNLLGDGKPGPMINATNGTNSLWVAPKDTTVYTIGFFQDGNGCPGTLAPGVEIGVNAPAAELMTNPLDICLGDTVLAEFKFQGGAPFDIQWALGTDTISESSGVTRALALTPTTQTVIQLLRAIDHRGCEASLPTPDTIRVFEAPMLTDVDLICLPDESGFTVTVSLTGGDPSGYQVSGLSGTFSGNTWTSDTLLNGTGFQLLLSDGGHALPIPSPESWIANAPTTPATCPPVTP